MRAHVTRPELNSATAVVVAKTRYSPGFRSEWHHNSKAQLIYPSRGVMTLHTREGSWVVPPLRACWLSPLEDHCVETSGKLEMHSVYCEGAVLRRLPTRSGIVPVSNLLRELILAMQELPLDPRTAEPVGRMALVLADQITLQRTQLLFAPPLLSERLRPIEDVLKSNPADSRTLQEWSLELATSTRTLARAFEREAHMTFTAYRRQMQLHAAIEKLAKGDAVTAIAYDLGFSSVSAFIAMFRKATGTTPKRYFASGVQQH
jgi:AraC-like DNA-binding protein